jgi:hypothetical protein
MAQYLQIVFYVLCVLSLVIGLFFTILYCFEKYFTKALLAYATYSVLMFSWLIFQVTSEHPVNIVCTEVQRGQ